MTQISRRGRPRAFQDKTAQNTIQSLDRAMAILEHLSRSEGMTLSNLATACGQSTATVYRVLVTLQQRDMVDLDPAGQVWHVGVGTFRAGTSFLRRTSLVERARAPMQALMRDSGETANLGVEQKDEVLFLTQVETHQAIRAFFPPGTIGPMHVSGIGKALLAWFDDARVVQVVERRGLQAFTPASLTTLSDLRADCAQTRARGFAFDDEERAIGMRCIAAPIFNPYGEPVAGVSVSGPAFRLDKDNLDRIGALVVQTAAQITAATGGVVPVAKAV
ncbi:MAG: IclR family transcriptional regulator [Rhodobacteraceae bacterium]|nr:IclR family transcriptional regulator [Paracoccaceae bacterium]